MKTIMVATDFSERSDRALRRATLLARQFNAQLSIIHVVDDDQPLRIVDSERDAAEDLLRELRTTVRTVDGVPCETRVVLADPFAGIARAVKTEAPDLLVIGPHRRQALRDVFVGTTAERTIRSVSSPVLMVNAPPVGQYGHVLLASDVTETAQHVASAFARLGIATGTKTTLLHVYDAPAMHLAMSHTIQSDDRQAYLDDLRRDASRALGAFAVAVGWHPVGREVRQSHGTPATGILATAKELAADLIVVGTHGRKGLSKFFLGSVAEGVLRASDRDVLAIPPPMNT